MTDFHLTKALGDAMSDYMTAVETTTDKEASARQLQERLRGERRRRLVVRSGLALATAAAVVAAVLIVSRERSKPAPSITPPTPSPTSTASHTAFSSRISPLVGLRLTLPSSQWRAEDSISDVAVNAPGIHAARIRISKGMFPTEPDGGFVETSISATRVIAALSEMPALRASRPVRVHLGDRLAAVYTDIRLSPSVPRSGFTYLTYKGLSGTVSVFTIKKGMVVRVYAAEYRAPYGTDLLNIAVEAPSAKVFAQWTDYAADVLQTLRLPKGLVPVSAFGRVGEAAR
jgi:hypothetical protein